MEGDITPPHFQTCIHGSKSDTHWFTDDSDITDQFTKRSPGHPNPAPTKFRLIIRNQESVITGYSQGNREWNNRENVRGYNGAVDLLRRVVKAQSRRCGPLHFPELREESTQFIRAELTEKLENIMDSRKGKLKNQLLMAKTSHILLVFVFPLRTEVRFYYRELRNGTVPPYIL